MSDDPDEMSLAKLDNSATLEGRDTARLIEDSFGQDAIFITDTDEGGFFVQILGEKVRTAGQLRDLAERYKRGDFGEPPTAEA